MAAEERAPAPSQLKAHEQDAVIQERLAVPERPLKVLMAKMNAIARAGDGEQASLAITAFALELEAFMLNLARIDAVADQTAEEEVQEYRNRTERVEEECDETERAIEALKRELVDVRQDRQNKLAYDGLANEIEKYGTREDLTNTLSGLQDTIAVLHGEAEKYDEIMQRSRDRFEAIAAQLEELRAEVGHEVGERERRAVERGREDIDVGGGGGGEEDGAEAGVVGAGEQRDGEAAGVRTSSDAAGERTLKRKPSILNPAAPTFRPSTRTERSRDSSPGVGSRRSGKRARASRRTSVQEEEIDNKQSRIDEEEGETSEADADEEEEEGAA